MSIARTKYKVTKSLLLMGILVTGLLSAFIGLVAFFGQYMGTFVISLDEGTASLGISLSEEPEFNLPTSRLLVTPINSAQPVTFNDIDFKGVVEKDGNFNSTKGNNYIGYSFYITNGGTSSVDIQLAMNIVEVTRDVDAASRITIIEDGGIDENGNLIMRHATTYIKEDFSDDDYVVKVLNLINATKDEELPSNLIESKDFYINLYNNIEKKNFLSDELVDNYTIENFKPGEVRRYSIIIWLEGWDPDCNDEIITGKLKMKLTYTIKGIYEEE